MATRTDLSVGDIEWIVEVMGKWASSRRWSLRGTSPNPLHLQRLFRGDAILQQAVWFESARPAGLVEITNYNDRDGVAELALLVDSDQSQALRPALAHFLRDVFNTVPLRKLTLWSFEDELDVPELLGGLAALAARLAEHERRGAGRYADLLAHDLWNMNG